jgi:hypothetical protein
MNTDVTVASIDIKEDFSDAVILPVPPPPPPKQLTSSSTDTDIPAVSLASVVVGLLGAFAVGTFAMRREREEELTSNAVTTSPGKNNPSVTLSSVDVSVPYDAAALLAYNEWRESFRKGSFDPIKFTKFKDNYIKVTVANVSAKKKNRDDGSPVVLKVLDDKADQASN